MPTTVTKISSLTALGTSPNGGSFLAVSQLVGPDYVLYKVTVSELLGNTITSLNGLTSTSQTFATPGTSGTAPNWSSSGSVHTLNIPLASASSVTAGLISKTQYDAAVAPFLATQLQNLVVASPDGVSGVLSVRALTNTDLPTVLPGKGGTGTTTAFTVGSVVFAGASGVYTQDNANFFWNNTDNYLGLGTNTSLAANLHIKGYGDGNTFGLITENLSGGKILRATNDGYIYIGNSSSNAVWIGSSYQGNETPTTTETGQNNLVFSTSLGNAAGSGFIFTNPSFTFSPPSGAANVISFGDIEFSANSGTGNFTAYNINPTYNQTLTASGTIRGLYYNPTVTSTTGTHRAIETVVGDVLIGSTSGKLYVGNQTTFFSSGEYGFSGVSPSLAQAGWIISNPTTLRAIDVSTITHADLAEVVGTLLQDLIDKGLILA